MAEGQDKKDEEKFEFTFEAEALGYISLEQARLQSIQHVRDNQAFYGSRYARLEPVWEVVGEEEGEDY
jgi:hypothetical protein